MTRILAQLTLGNALILLAAFGVGVLSWATGGFLNPDQPTYLVHFCLGLFAVILNLGLHCLVFIYFLGTGRWVKEVAAAYSIPDDPLPKTTRTLKRKTFPVALLAMLLPIAAAAAGMWRQQTLADAAAVLHFLLALTTLAINVWAFWIEYRNVRINAGIIDQVMAEVERIRAERGLPPSDVAWEQEQKAG